MRRLLLGLSLLSLSVGCEPVNKPTGGSSPTSPSPSPTVSVTTADLQFCVNETNRYRTNNGRPEVTRSAALETFALEGAKEDGASTVPHLHFDRTHGGNGTAFAENELHRVSFAFFDSIQDAMRLMMGAFYGEGPSGGHYQNLMGAFTQVGCGVFIASNGEVTIAQDFR